jgi:hypothetical protein
VQKEPRRTLRRQDRKQSALSCGLTLGGVVLVGGLGLLGAYLAGTAGFFLGLIVGLVAALALWFFAFSYLLSIRPPI